MEYYEEIKEYLLEKEPNYFISCIEENKKEELHIHIYVQFPKRVSISTEHTHGAHIEACKGSPMENKHYIEKIKETFRINNTLDEMGTIRGGGIKSDSVLSLMDKSIEEVSKTDFKIWKEIVTTKPHFKGNDYKPNVEIYYIWGPSGVGKSKKVFDMIADDEPYDRVYYSNGFWLGVGIYQPVKTCWYDEFRDSNMPVAEFIKFVDYYKDQMSVKYCPGWVNQYERIFITSIQSPHEIYKNLPEESREQWLRRMKIIHMEKL